MHARDRHQRIARMPILEPLISLTSCVHTIDRYELRAHTLCPTDNPSRAHELSALGLASFSSRYGPFSPFLSAVHPCLSDSDGKWLSFRTIATSLHLFA